MALHYCSLKKLVKYIWLHTFFEQEKTKPRMNWAGRVSKYLLIFWKNNNSAVISTFCPSMKILSWFWPQLLPWFVLGGFIMMHHVTIFLAKSWQRIYPPWNFSSCPCQPPESILEKLGNCQVSILYKKFSSFVRS